MLTLHSPKGRVLQGLAGALLALVLALPAVAGGGGGGGGGHGGGGGGSHGPGGGGPGGGGPGGSFGGLGGSGGGGGMAGRPAGAPVDRGTAGAGNGAPGSMERSKAPARAPSGGERSGVSGFGTGGSLFRGMESRDAGSPMGPGPAVPPDSTVHRFRGQQYFQSQGSWFVTRAGQLVTVPAPVGLVVDALPAGHETRWIDGVPYFVSGDAYYVWRERERKYEIVETPAGGAGAVSAPASPSPTPSPAFPSPN